MLPAILKLFFLITVIFLLFTSDDVLYSQEVKYETGDLKFEFRKTESFTDAALLDILLLPREKFFNRINLEEDLQRLNKFYFDNGFFDAIIDTSTSVDKDDNEIDVKFIIIEKPQYNIKEITFHGLDKLPAEITNEINNNKVIEAGSPYNKNKINLERDRIIDILLNHGYYYAQIDTGRSKIDSSRTGIIIGKYSDEMQQNPEYKNKVLVGIRFIGTNDVFRFGKIKIKIENNKYDIKKNVIQREMAFKEGDIFSKSKILESEKNLSKHAIIQLGRVVPVTIYRNLKIIDMDVNITLNKKYEITPSIFTSYQTNRLFLGTGIEYKDKDFFGGGRVFSISAEGQYNSTYINALILKLSLFQPFLFNNNITATYTPELGFLNLTKQLQYLVWKNLLRTTYFIADYTFYNNAFSDITFDYLKLKFDVLGNGVYDNLYLVNSILGLTLVHNNTNNLFNPSKGFYHSITFESAGNIPRLINIFNKSLNYSQYYKLNTVNSFYFDISGDRQTSIVATNFEIGDIIEYGKSENIIPVTSIYKYFMGGGNSLRGWRAQTGGILDKPEEGGNFLVKGSLEWRRKPFPQRSFFYPVWGVVFLDYGNVWETDRYFKLNQVALSCGFGIRYDSFIGPIRVDLGFKLYDPLAANGEKWLWQKPSAIFKNKYAIQFGLGNAF
ncbi:MAG: BamA/TamA family outer membrane protein [Ignavibacteria bacterium]|nr:BamA/TamA family outer membrane protein [Ignavibacteria bacterium]